MLCFRSGTEERFNPYWDRFLTGYVRLTCLLLLVIFLGSGCALNDRGVVKVRRYENDTAYLVCLEAWGGHLITNAADAGLTIGRSKRLYVYPKPQDGKHGSASEQAFIPSGNDHSMVAVDERQGFPQLQVLGEPAALVTNTIGLAFSLNQLGFEIALGAQARGMIRLPQDFEGRLLFRYNSENTNNTQVYIGGGSR